MSIFEKRRQNLRNAMLYRRIDASIFTPSTDYLYLTGSYKQPAQRISALILTQKRSVLLLPCIEAENEPQLADELEILTYSDLDNAEKIICSLLPPKGRIAIGREMRAGFLLSMQALSPELQWQNADALLSPIRRKKEPEEIQMIEEAQHMAERALTKLLSEPIIGKTECELASRLMELRLDEGFDSVGPGIVASGPNTALPHHTNGERVLSCGDVLMFDIGGVYKGYRADFTRTFAVGKIPESFSEIYHVVLQAHITAKAAVKENVPAAEIDRIARDIIEKAGYGAYFTHRLGHGIGLDIHEEPFISSTNRLPLEIGNVFSCEPGIYIPGQFGVRIEDLLVLEKNGARSLNTLTKELTVI